MKKLLITIMLFLVTAFGTNSVHSADTNPSFAIYLSQADPGSETLLSKIKFSKVPFLTDADIIEYRWGQHEISLSPQGIKKFRQLPKRREEGRTFVVVVDGVRCYHGALWLSILSASYPHPVILIDSPSPNTFTIERAYPSPAFGEGKDPRSDRRIYDALKGKNKLKEMD